jgi:integrase
MEILRVLLNFARDTYETPSGEPVIQVNPVIALNRNRSWHRAKQRQRIIPDAKLPLWYSEVMKLRQKYIRDYLLLLLLTDFRRTECATLRWNENIDLENRIITIGAEITKNGREHRVPMSDFVYQLLIQRYEHQPRNIEYVFPGRGGTKHLVDPTHVIAQISHRCGCPFVLHDLRRYSE